MKSKKSKTILILLACIVCLALIFAVLFMQQGSIRNEKLKVTVLKVGKADAIVLESGEKAMMIDTGEADDAEKIVKFLKDEGVTTLDALIITHYDKDHMGGASLILEQFNVARVLIPDYEYSGNREEYTAFVNSMNATSVIPEKVSEATEFAFGETAVLVEPPVDYDVDVIAEAVEDFDNTMSLFTTVTCGEKKFLFTGDADRRRINEWLQHTSVGDVDFLKVPHHGLFNASMEDLIKATTPEYAAITCSKKNPADATTIDLLIKNGVNVFQTSDGRITAVTDGKKIKVQLN